jgi:ribosomal protein S6--L-glutamate ligase
MKICIIALNKNDYAPKRIFKCGKKLGHKMYLSTWNEVALELRSGKVKFTSGGETLEHFDAIILRNCKTVIRMGRKKTTLHRETLLRLLVEYSKNNNIFLLNNRYLSDYQSLDKLSQQYFLFQNNLPGIPTHYFFDNKKKVPLNFPFVSKIADGSLGKQVSKIENPKQLNTFLDDRKKDGEFFLFQQFCKIEHDYRILVVGNKTLGIMRRVAKNGEWRTNFSLGGTTEKADRDRSIEKLALLTAKKMKLDYVGVDILRHKGKLLIIEINSFAQFRGFEKTFPGVDVATEVIQLVETKFKKLKESSFSKH